MSVYDVTLQTTFDLNKSGIVPGLRWHKERSNKQPGQNLNLKK